MPETLLEQHAAALRLFGERVREVGETQWDAPTPVPSGPCGTWSAT